MNYLYGIVGLLALGVGVWNFGGSHQQINLQKSINPSENYSDELDNYQVVEIDYVKANDLISSENTPTLSQLEVNGLMFMREEEKLARDVYLALFEYWQLPIFNNIAGSENTHMEAVLTLLEKYDIADSASSESGKFNNESLQELYDQLVSYGKESKTTAFNVGAKIEDLDIKDLAENISNTNNPDIRVVYEALQRGSRNHLRAFNRQLKNETGSNYVPEYISTEEFNSIISSSIERGGGQGTEPSRGQNGSGGNGNRGGQGRN